MKAKENGGTQSMSMVPPATGSSIINVGKGERLLSVVGGLALAGLGLGSMRKSKGIAMLIGGGYLMARGLSGYCVFNNLIGRNDTYQNASAIEASLTFMIDKPREEIYAYWRRLENLPQFMKHLSSVMQKDDKLSTWTATIPGGLGTISWDAEIIEDQRNEYIAWQSLPGSGVDNAGEILFSEIPGLPGTEVSVVISYRLPGGDLGSLAAKFINPVVESMLNEDLLRFRDFMEKGVLPESARPNEIKQFNIHHN